MSPSPDEIDSTELPPLPREAPTPASVAPPEEPLGAALHGLRTRGPDLVFRMLIVGTFLVLVWPFHMPLLLGGLSAMVLLPLDQRLRLRLGRFEAASSAIVMVGAVVGILGPFVWVAWSAARALNQFVAGLTTGGVGATRDRLTDVLVSTFGTSDDRLAMDNSVDEAIKKIGTGLAQWLGNLAKALPEGLTETFLFLLALYFGLRDGPRLVRWLRRVSPVSARRTTQLFDAVRRSVHGTLVGMLAVSAVQGALSLLALIICRVQHALLWGFVAFLCSAVPIVGTTPVTLGAAIWLYLQNRPVAALAMIGAAVVIGLSDNVVRPWVQSQHDDMHPLLSLLAIFGGLAVFGPAGLILGPLLASMSVWAVETYRDEARG